MSYILDQLARNKQHSSRGKSGTSSQLSYHSSHQGRLTNIYYLIYNRQHLSHLYNCRNLLHLLNMLHTPNDIWHSSIHPMSPNIGHQGSSPHTRLTLSFCNVCQKHWQGRDHMYNIYQSLSQNMSDIQPSNSNRIQSPHLRIGHWGMLLCNYSLHCRNKIHEHSHRLLYIIRLYSHTPGIGEHMLGNHTGYSLI